MNNIELPVGFSMALAMNSSAMRNFAGMTFDERKRIVNKARTVFSKEDMQGLIEEIGRYGGDV